MTSSGVLSSFISWIRRSSVVLNTAVAPVFEKPAGRIKSRQVWRLFGLPAAIFQIERDPPTASELLKLKYQK
jgi:hypothetical protein